MERERRHRTLRILIGITVMIILAGAPFVILSHYAGGWGVTYFKFTTDRGTTCTNDFTGYHCNRVTLADETDRHGLPVARFSYSQCDNDREMIEAAKAKSREVLDAAGAEDVVTIDRYAHLIGGARMGATPSEGVVDRDLRSFAVPNLYVTDGSVLPTQGAANPALTIMALAARCADHLTSANRAA